MTHPKALLPVGKGQLRCFECRQACPMKDGDWQHHKSQQVFVCKTCQRAQRLARHADMPKEA